MADNTSPLQNVAPMQSPALAPPAAAGSAQSVPNLQQQLQPAHQDPVNHPAFGAPPEQEMQTLIAQIADIDRPPEIGTWPLAPGWWVLLVVVALGTGVGMFALYKTIRRRAYRRSALRLLKRLGDGSGLSRSGLARQLNEVLKRTALASPFYRHLYIGSAHTDAWRDFLCASSPEFPEKAKIIDNLLQSVYRPKAQLDAALSIAFCEFWIRQHHHLPAEVDTSGATKLSSIKSGEARHV